TRLAALALSRRHVDARRASPPARAGGPPRPHHGPGPPRPRAPPSPQAPAPPLAPARHDRRHAADRRRALRALADATAARHGPLPGAAPAPEPLMAQELDRIVVIDIE